MNFHKFAKRRDNEVIDTLSLWHCLDTQQINILFFGSLRVAQRRLTILTNKNLVNRSRSYIDESNCYYIGKIPDNYKKIIALNWVRIWLQKNTSYGNKLVEFKYFDQHYDGVATVQNRLANREITIKIDVINSINDFKPNKYKVNDISFCENILTETKNNVLIISDRALNVKAKVMSIDMIKGLVV